MGVHMCMMGGMRNISDEVVSAVRSALLERPEVAQVNVEEVESAGGRRMLHASITFMPGPDMYPPDSPIMVAAERARAELLVAEEMAARNTQCIRENSPLPRAPRCPRNARLVALVTRAELDAIRAQAAAAGLSVGEWVRGRVLG